MTVVDEQAHPPILYSLVAGPENSPEAVEAVERVAAEKLAVDAGDRRVRSEVVFRTISAAEAEAELAVFLGLGIDVHEHEGLVDYLKQWPEGVIVVAAAVVDPA